MSNTRQFIDQLASGESAAAKETLESALTAKSFEALESYKKEMSAGIFGGQQETQPEIETETAE
jgi:hypothetical protein